MESSTSFSDSFIEIKNSSVAYFDYIIVLGLTCAMYVSKKHF